MSDLYLPENYIPAIGAAIARAIRRFNDPEACGEAIAACFSRALIDDTNIETVVGLIDAQPGTEGLTMFVDVGNALPQDVVDKIEAGLTAYREGRVVERKRPDARP